jgi:hypothetical protein
LVLEDEIDDDYLHLDPDTSPEEGDDELEGYELEENLDDDQENEY